jgi:hypothetical protein
MAGSMAVATSPGDNRYEYRSSGAAGRQIVRELSPTHPVLLSTGRPRLVRPNRILGKNVFWWITNPKGTVSRPRSERGPHDEDLPAHVDACRTGCHPHDMVNAECIRNGGGAGSGVPVMT